MEEQAGQQRAGELRRVLKQGGREVTRRLCQVAGGSWRTGVVNEGETSDWTLEEGTDHRWRGRHVKSKRVPGALSKRADNAGGLIRGAHAIGRDGTGCGRGN